MINGVSRRRRWLLGACALAVCAIAVAAAVAVYVSGQRRDAAEAFCVEIAQQEHPGSTISVRSTAPQGFSEVEVSGVASNDRTGTVGFSCMAHSDGRNAWGSLAGDE